MMTHTIASIISLAVLRLALVHAQDTETVWSSVLVTLYGDRVPLISPDLSILTPLGAQQLYSAGSLFRDRYLAPSLNASSDYIINGISPFGELD